jgi:hypothetical protein
MKLFSNLFYITKQQCVIKSASRIVVSHPVTSHHVALRHICIGLSRRQVALICIDSHRRVASSRRITSRRVTFLPPHIRIPSSCCIGESHHCVTSRHVPSHHILGGPPPRRQRCCSTDRVGSCPTPSWTWCGGWSWTGGGPGAVTLAG